MNNNTARKDQILVYEKILKLSLSLVNVLFKFITLILEKEEIPVDWEI